MIDVLVARHPNLQDNYLTYAEHDILKLLSGSFYPTIGDMRIVMMSLLAHLDINSVENVNSQVEVASAIKAKLEPHARFTLQKMYDEYNSNNIQTALPRLTSTHSIFRALIQSTSSNNQYNTHEIEQYFQLPLEVDHINPLEW
ncbi:3866_t:CDS:2 [Ambispora gerdemannii]|uniref:3866_t:CDS:1 n=1 Tax=Ambispora gerdemannii TaxID=144530 RepID=A0A9N9H4Z8_9GLOM|nr:3866_t:CDS:2 [Ambispora gerdemannii]